MPEINTSPLINLDALNQVYHLLRLQMDERVYNTATNPNEILGSVERPYSQAYLAAINDNNSNWYINSSAANFSNVNINGTLTTTGNTVLGGTVNITGNTTIGGTLTTTGNTVLGGTVNITGNTTIGGTLGITGATTISSSLNVTGSSTLAGAQINGNLGVSGDINASGEITGSKVWNAVWNDIADAITVEQDIKFEPGYAYAFDGEKWFKTKGKDSPYFGIHSDTAGYILGLDKESNQIHIAIGGFVLAHVDKIYPTGTFLTYGKDGILTKAEEKDEKIAKFFKEEKRPLYKGREVMSRHWIKIL